MFDSNQIEQFRQIKAPAELRAKVLGTKRVPMRTVVLRYGSLAACLVIMMTAVLLFRGHGDGIAVTMDGHPVTSEGVYTVLSTLETAHYSIARVVTMTEDQPLDQTLEIPLEFDVTGECTVNVSSGSLLHNGEETDSGAQLIADGSLNLIWHIESADREAYYSLVLQNDGEQVVLVMKYSGGWMIRLNEN